MKLAKDYSLFLGIENNEIFDEKFYDQKGSNFDVGGICNSKTSNNNKPVNGKNDKCCGEYPARYPYSSNSNSRKCCQNKTYLVNTLKCCENTGELIGFGMDCDL